MALKEPVRLIECRTPATPRGQVFGVYNVDTCSAEQLEEQRMGGAREFVYYRDYDALRREHEALQARVAAMPCIMHTGADDATQARLRRLTLELAATLQDLEQARETRDACQRETTRLVGRVRELERDNATVRDLQRRNERLVLEDEARRQQLEQAVQAGEFAISCCNTALQEAGAGWRVTETPEGLKAQSASPDNSNLDLVVRSMIATKAELEAQNHPLASRLPWWLRLLSQLPRHGQPAGGGQ